MNDTRIDTAIADIGAAVEAITKAKTTLNELIGELGAGDGPLVWAVVDLGHAARNTNSIINNLRRAKEAA